MGLKEKLISIYRSQKETNKLNNTVFQTCELTKEEKETQKQVRYKQRVNRLIREKYSVDEELAILRQQNNKDEEYQEYYNYCEECKAKAKAEVYGNEV